MIEGCSCRRARAEYLVLAAALAGPSSNCKTVSRSRFYSLAFVLHRVLERQILQQNWVRFLQSYIVLPTAELLVPWSHMARSMPLSGIRMIYFSPLAYCRKSAYSFLAGSSDLGNGKHTPFLNDILWSSSGLLRVQERWSLELDYKRFWEAAHSVPQNLRVCMKHGPQSRLFSSDCPSLLHSNLLHTIVTLAVCG
ncbi:hypothetical protein F5884DRAFT_183430 [Xylogone sp. PMI_703]|nr:hypothetical protein F5884DRAFT_183430 [Xylogone sp. PMI_703]